MLVQPRSINELPSVNKGVARSRFVQVAPSRSLTGTAFSGGQVHFAWTVSGSTLWCPKKSYFRFRVKYADGAGTTQLDQASGISPNMNMLSNLFQSAEIRIGGQTVSRASSNMAQIDSFKSRISHSGIWLSTLGELQNFTAADDIVRSTEITSDLPVGISELDALRQAMGLELIWRPPLSLLDTRGCLPAGQYEIVLNPSVEGTYQRGAIASVENKVPGVDFRFEIVDAFWYASLVDGDSIESSAQYVLDLADIDCQIQSVDTTSLAQTFFQVPSSTSAIALAFQDNRVLTDTRFSASKFIVQNGGNTAQQEVNLSRLFISYANQQKPQPDANPEYDRDANSTVDRSTQRYYETYDSAGALWESAPPESYQEWTKRGRFYYFRWQKDGSDASTRVVVSSEMRDATVTHMNMLLFSVSRKAVQVTVKDGLVTEVTVIDR